MATLVENILRTAVEEGFVQFVNGQLVFKEGVIDLAQQPGGNALVQRVAYASDLNGTGFTLVNDPLFEYMAFALLPSDAIPVAANFAGQWFPRRGLPGNSPAPIPGADGQQAGFRINIVTTDITATKPGTGKIKFNHADLSLATEMYLDEMMPSGNDLSGVINQFVDGMTFMLRLNAASSAALAVFEFTAAPTDNGDWFTIPIVNRAMPVTSFADGDQCVFQFFGGGNGAAAVTEAAILAAGNFARFVSNGAGGYVMKDNTNTIVKSISPVYKLPSISITGVSDLPAANTFSDGAVVRLHKDNLVGAGANPLGIWIQADAVNNLWRPLGSQNLFWKNFGTFAAPTLTLTAAGKFDLGAGGDPVIPAPLLYLGGKLVFFWRWRKIGTTTPTLRINFGTDLAARENNSIVYVQQAAGTANLDVPGKSEVDFITATSARCSNRAVTGGSGGASSGIDASTLLNVAAAMKTTYEAQILSGDTVQMLEFGIVWEL